MRCPAPQDITAAGGTIDLLHHSLTNARILEACQRGYGYTAADIPHYAADLFERVNELEYLHQGEQPGSCSNMLLADYHSHNRRLLYTLVTQCPAELYRRHKLMAGDK